MEKRHAPFRIGKQSGIQVGLAKRLTREKGYRKFGGCLSVPFRACHILANMRVTAEQIQYDRFQIKTE
jgi:hypothetical protein